MNDMAVKIGMASSRFGTASGWPDGGVTKVSAGELVLLASRLIRDHPDAYARYFPIPKFQHGISPDGQPIIQATRTPILGRFAGADWRKHINISEAGFYVFGSVNSA